MQTPTAQQIGSIGALLTTMQPMNLEGAHLAWENGVLHLRGPVTSTEVKAAIAAKATELFGADGVVDELVVTGEAGSTVADTAVASVAPADTTAVAPTVAAVATTAAAPATTAAPVTAAATTTVPPTTTAVAVTTTITVAPTTTVAPQVTTTLPVATTTAAPAPTTAPTPVPTTALTAAAAEVAGDIKAVLAGGTVEFDLGSAKLTAAGAATVSRLAAALAKQPGVSVTIAGHTDNLGAPSWNGQLSLARANTVRDALIAQGIAATRLTAKGFGSTKPIGDNATAAGRQKNRRIEFTPSGG